MLTIQYSFLNEAHQSWSYQFMWMTSSSQGMTKHYWTPSKMQLAHDSRPPTLVKPPGSLGSTYDMTSPPVLYSLTKHNTSRVSYLAMVWRTATLCPHPFHPVHSSNLHLLMSMLPSLLIPTLKRLAH